MASTRNINTPGDYCIQQNRNTQSENYKLYTNSSYGYAYDTKLPGNGLGNAQIPWDKMSHNAADVESFLFGINSTNLINPAPCFKPQLIYNDNCDIFDKGNIIMPKPLVVEKKQRPLRG